MFWVKKVDGKKKNKYRKKRKKKKKKKKEEKKKSANLFLCTKRKIGKYRRFNLKC